MVKSDIWIQRTSKCRISFLLFYLFKDCHRIIDMQSFI